MENDGLGEVVYDEDALLLELQDIVEQQCMMPLKYRQRVDTFFTYHDNNNCERIYKAVLTLLGKIAN